MVHKKEEDTYHHIKKLMKEMPGFLSPWERLASLLLLSRFSCVQLCATPQTAAYQAPPSLGFSR